MRYLYGWFMTRSPRIKLSILGMVLLAVTMVAIHRPALDAFRGWRAERLVAQAASFAEEENWDQVQRTAMASLQLRNSIEGRRLLLSAYEDADHPQVLALAVGILQLPDAQVEDRLRAIRLSLDYGDIVTAAGLVRSVNRQELEVPALRYQVVRFHLRAGNESEAIRIVDDTAEEENAPALELLLVKGLALTDNPETIIANSARLLRVLSGADDQAALGALRFIASLPEVRVERNMAEKALERFGNDHRLRVSDRLRLDFFRIVLRLGEREDLIEAAVLAYRDHDLEILVGWLERLNEFERILELTELDSFKKEPTPSLFAMRVSALEKLGRFVELEDELARPSAPIGDVPLICARATIATQLGKKSKALILWKQAIARARRAPGKNFYYFIASSARRAGNTEVYMDALAHGIESLLGPPPPAGQVAELFSWLYEKDDTERLMRLSYRLLEREPGNPLLINNFHYLKILQGECSEDDVKALRRIVEAFPEEPAFASSLALGLVMNGEPEAALSVLDSLETMKRPRSEAIIRAAVLSEEQKRAADFSTLLGEVDWNQFSSAEQRVLQNLLN